MATFNKFNCFVGDLGLKVHNLNTDTLQAALCSVAPVATNTVKANLTQVANGNGYTTDGADINNLYSQTSGTGSLTSDDTTVWTGSGAGFGPLRYVVLLNNTAAGGPLIGWWDYTSSVSVGAGETFTVDWGATVLTIA